MNPVHLHTFLSIWRHRSFTRAAEELALSQPAVSRQIKSLEHDLGVRLFEQIGRSLHLTAAGDLLLGQAQRLLGDLERVAESVRTHEQPAGRRALSTLNAGVVAGGHILSVHEPRPAHQEVELDPVVTGDAWMGSPAPLIFGHEVVQHMCTELPLHVEDVVGYANDLTHAARVLNVLH